MTLERYNEIAITARQGVKPHHWQGAVVCELLDEIDHLRAQVMKQETLIMSSKRNSFIVELEISSESPDLTVAEIAEYLEKFVDVPLEPKGMNKKVRTISIIQVDRFVTENLGPTRQ